MLLDRAATLDLVAELTDKAVAHGAQLVVFPEAFVPGPPVWIDALPVWEDADWHALLMRESVTVPGPACDRLAKIAAPHARTRGRCEPRVGTRRGARDRYGDPKQPVSQT